MKIARYLYEIIEDYKKCDSDDAKNDIFNLFCSYIWTCDNKRKIINKTIRFKVKRNLLNTEVGRIFDTWSEIEYKGYKSMTSETDWCNLIRQKINNLYTRYFDKSVILKKDYMYELGTAKRLYYQWIDGRDIDPDELTSIIDDAISRALELKSVYQKQKMKLSWSEYKVVIEEVLRRTLNKCKLIDDFEDNGKLTRVYDFMNEDNLYVSYICKCLDGEMRDYQKKYYGLKRGRNKKYTRCMDCGCLINKTGNKKMFCDKCSDVRIRKSNKISNEKYKNKKRENRNL